MSLKADQFPILERGIYANHAAIAPWPRPTADAVRAFAEENAFFGPEHYKGWIAREKELKTQLASLIGARSSQDIALLKNTTEGICTVAFGFSWCEGDNLVLPKGEFSSNRLPWLAQKTRGVEVREVDIRQGDDPEAALIEAIDRRTRILSVSSVQFDDGLRLDLRRLGAVCRQNGVLFFVDAIQQLGALALDVEACNIDCLAADAHKWLLGPEGVALFYCNAKARKRVALQQLGWHMFEYPWKFDRDDWEPAASARRFEAGSPNTVGQVAFLASLRLILDESLDGISARVLENTRQLIAGLDSMPHVQVKSDCRPERQSGIVSFGVREYELAPIFSRLRERSVTCAIRKGAIRLSPHFYQDGEVMQRLLNAVEDALRH